MVPSAYLMASFGSQHFWHDIPRPAASEHQSLFLGSLRLSHIFLRQTDITGFEALYHLPLPAQFLLVPQSSSFLSGMTHT
jgi:hypothetical protein